MYKYTEWELSIWQSSSEFNLKKFAKKTKICGNEKVESWYFNKIKILAFIIG